MIEQFIKDPVAVERYRGGLAGPHIDSFAGLLSGRGYSTGTIKEKLRAAMQLGGWLEQQGLGLQDLDEDRVACYLAGVRKQAGELRHKVHRAMAPIFLEHLRRRGVVPLPVPRHLPEPFSEILGPYERYLREERGLCGSTCTHMVREIRYFLTDALAGEDSSLNRLDASAIAGYMRRHGLRGGRGRAQWMGCALRSFLRFLHQKGETATDLAAAVPAVRRARLADLPKSLHRDQVERVLEAVDRTSAGGKRDYAILLLLARLGLRAGEVVALRLEDIDWRAGEISVRGKGGRLDRLPLLQEVGAALADYLHRGRPSCASRRAFVLARAPWRGLCGPGTVTTIVRRAIQRAGLDPPHKGAHLLRHSLACRMLAGGASLPEIGEVLRHQLPSTTEIYAKVDLEALRALARPWPVEGGAP